MKNKTQVNPEKRRSSKKTPLFSIELRALEHRGPLSEGIDDSSRVRAHYTQPWSNESNGVGVQRVTGMWNSGINAIMAELADGRFPISTRVNYLQSGKMIVEHRYEIQTTA